LQAPSRVASLPRGHRRAGGWPEARVGGSRNWGNRRPAAVRTLPAIKQPLAGGSRRPRAGGRQHGRRGPRCCRRGRPREAGGAVRLGPVTGPRARRGEKRRGALEAAADCALDCACGRRGVSGRAGFAGALAVGQPRSISSWGLLFSALGESMAAAAGARGGENAWAPRGTERAVLPPTAGRRGPGRRALPWRIPASRGQGGMSLIGGRGWSKDSFPGGPAPKCMKKD
jgi:hypothetical protein